MFRCYSGTEITLEMIRQAVSIDKQVYSSDFQGIYEACIKWWEKNPYIYVMVEDCDAKKIVGYINAIPLSDTYYNNIRNGDIVDTKLPLEEIKVYHNNERYKLYFSSIAIHPDYQNTTVFKTLLNGFKQHVSHLQSKGIFFSNVIADVVSDMGGKLCKHFGLKYVQDSKHNSKIYEGKLNDYRERYKRIGESENFKKHYEGKSLGEVIEIDC